MLSDDTIKNRILYRNETAKLPFLVPVNPPTKSILRNPDENKQTRKTVRIMRPETLKRAQNDLIMAASIGDLKWLKQTLKIVDENICDKNGFYIIHLASIHGRLNILQFLIEEKLIDVNSPSKHGWRPIHLCISKQIGDRAIKCLRYLVEKGADINSTNEDNLTPLHVAATEGQFECLKALVDLHADSQIKDVRGHTALDLAKIWGHRSCGKFLDSIYWYENKRVSAYNDQLERRYRTQEVLKEIERAHFAQYRNADESEEMFNEWLIGQGFRPRTDQENSIYIQDTMTQPDEDTTKLDSTEKDFKFKTKKLVHPKDWDYSTRPDESEYVSNLDDFYPRDPFTQLPDNVDLVLVNRELRGMSLEQVKEFMRQKLPRNFVETRKSSNERPVYYKPKHVKDLPKKSQAASTEAVVKVDEAGVNLTNDTRSFPFRQVKHYLNKCEKKSSNIDTTVKLIKKQLAASDDENLSIVRRDYGRDLGDFMTDKRHGRMSQKYEKVFIC